MIYAQHVSGLKTPQTEAARSNQVQNNAGGFVFEVSIWTRLDRFLILGAEGGSYYAGEKKLVKDNFDSLKLCLKEDGLRTVARIVEISKAGRAPKNDSAIFCLAVASSPAHADKATRKAAISGIMDVCRTGTHLFQYVESVRKFRGWGRSLREGVAKWYDSRSENRLAMQLLKYQQRDGMSHRDVLRFSHPTKHQALYRWATTGAEGGGDRVINRKGAVKEYADPGKLPDLLAHYEEFKGCSDPRRLIQMISEHGFTHEMIPTEMKNRADVWEALLVDMPLTATIRNLGKMTAVGLIKPLSSASRTVAEKLQDHAALKDQRVHPITVLAAMKVYAQGHGVKGKLTWSPDRLVLDALDATYYLAFDAVEPTGKSHMLAIDVSGSMASSMVNGMDFLSAREAAAAMAMVTARVEKNWHCIGFTGGHGEGGWRSPRFRKNRWSHSGMGSDNVDSGCSPLKISPRMRMDDVVEHIGSYPMGGTDCALPMIYALENKIEVDVFHIYTDNETWAGNMHPMEALKEYRQKMGRPAKLVVGAFSVTEFSIADPTDSGMLDIVGFDTNAPAIIADFVSS
jgi:60 kDa SS-A/Ro ribonucleoprotein